MLGSRLRRLKEGTEHLNYGRDTISDMVRRQFADPVRYPSLSVLDLGLGYGEDLQNVSHALPDRDVRLFGVDSEADRVERVMEQNVTAVQLDIERARLPFADEFLDLVIANQVIEHTKEIFWIFAEISRTLKKGGSLIVGVPNLASLHNRVLLALGEQPACIELLGPHVRGFTKRSFSRFIRAGDYFTVVLVRGANFYPFPATFAVRLSRWLPTLSVGLVFLCQRTDKPGTFLEVLKAQNFETNYFSGTDG